jgi:hypothetical protein
VDFFFLPLGFLQQEILNVKKKKYHAITQIAFLMIPVQTLMTLKIISFQPQRPGFSHENIQGGGEP